MPSVIIACLQLESHEKVSYGKQTGHTAWMYRLSLVVAVHI